MPRPMLGAHTRTDNASAGLAPVSSADPRQHRYIAAAYLAVAVLLPAVGAWALLSANTAGRIASFDDDAYYYFRIAHHIVTGAGSTYDGFGRTNGYHPLWMLLLLPVFRLGLSPLSVLPVVYLLAAVVWAATFATVFAIGRQLRRPVAIAVAVLPVAVFGSRFSGPGGIFLGGMEVIVTLLCLMLLLWTCLRTGYLSVGLPHRNISLVVGLILAVLFLSRLDTTFFIAAFLLLAARRWRGRRRERLIALTWTALPVVVAALGYVSVNRWYFGTATPVSGQSKSLGTPNFNGAPIIDFLRFGDALGHHVYLGAVTLLLTAAALAVWARARSGPPIDPATQTVGCFLLTSSVGLAALFGYLVFFTSYQTWSWYFYLLPVNLLLAIFMLVDLGLGSRLDRAGTRAAAAVALAAVAVPLATGALQFRQLRRETANSTWVDHADAVASWLNTRTPSDSVMAMGDSAGAVGYLLDRRLIQLEGLVEYPEYLHALSAGTAVSFLRDKGVGYVIMTRPAAELPLDAGCHPYVEPLQGHGPKMTLTLCSADVIYDHRLDDGRRYVVWAFQPELNR